MFKHIGLRYRYVIFIALLNGCTPAIESVPVVVAKVDVLPGTVVEEPGVFFKVVHYVKGDEPANAITDFNSLKGMQCTRFLAADQPVKSKQLAKAVKGFNFPPPQQAAFHG